MGDIGIENENVKKYRFIPSVRFLVAIMACSCLAIQYAQRMNLTIGIVAMTNKTALAAVQEKNESAPNDSKSTVYAINDTDLIKTDMVIINGSDLSVEKQASKFKDGPFIWDKPTKGRILSSYFFGYIAFQVGGGVMAYKYGPYKVLLIAMTMGTITTLLTPAVARIGYVLVMFVRFLTGLSASVVWPAMVELSSRWSPKDEKSIIMAIGNSGAQIGPLISMPLFGALCQCNLFGGWPLVFYSSGLMGVIWCVCCFIFLTSSPENHKFISMNERMYIEQNVVLKVVGKQAKIPVKKIFTTIPCLAMFASHFFKAFGFYTILTNVSTYNEEVLKLDIKASGMLTAIPYLVYFICTIGSGKIADIIIKKNLVEAGTCRKLFTGIGSFGPAVTVLALGYVNENMAWLGITLISLTLGFLGCNSGGGMYIVAQDMAPKYAGIIWGISNTFGTAPGIIVPLIIGQITKNATQGEWRIVFIICSISYVISGVVFIVFGSGKLLPWAATSPMMDRMEQLTIQTEKDAEVKSEELLKTPSGSVE